MGAVMTIQDAANLYLLHVHNGQVPSMQTLLYVLPAAGRVLKAAGIDTLNVQQLQTAAKEQA